MSTVLGRNSDHGGAVSQTWEYDVAVETQEDGSFVASCAELDIAGVHAFTEEEALDAIASMIAARLEAAPANP